MLDEESVSLCQHMSELFMLFVCIQIKQSRHSEKPEFQQKLRKVLEIKPVQLSVTSVAGRAVSVGQKLLHENKCFSWPAHMMPVSVVSLQQ